MKKFIILLLVIIFVFNCIPDGNRVIAAPSSEDIKWIITSKLKGFSQALDNSSSYGGQYGLYYNLYYLTLMARWTDFMTDFENLHNLNFMETELEGYKESLIKNFEIFNSRFSSERENFQEFKYTPLEITITGNSEDFKLILYKFLGETVPEYLEERLIEIINEIENTEEESIIIQENKESLRYIYKILNILTTEQQEMERLSNTVSVIVSTKAMQLISDEGSYRRILEMGKAIDEEELNKVGNLSLINSTEYLERLAHVRLKEITERNKSDIGASLWKQTETRGLSSDNFMLQDVYMRMLASTAVYRPMLSYVGDKEYVEALRSLSGNEADAVIALFDEIKDFRKPLYLINDASKWFESEEVLKMYEDNLSEEERNKHFRYSGKASLITLDKFIDLVEKETLTGLVMMTGKLETSQSDSNSYFYFSDNPDFRVNSISTDEDSVDSTFIVNNIVSSAGEEETSTKWTSPVFESGGRPYQGSMYRATSLTTAILKNAFKDNKQISEIKDISTEFLYMNAFGDIVTKDNLVIFPGIANPKLYDLSQQYIPYSVTFMQGYPNVYSLGGGMRLGSDNNIDKYVLLSANERGKASTFVRIKGENNLATTEPRVTGFINLELAEPIGEIKNGLEVTEVSSTLEGTWYNITWNHIKGLLGSGKIQGHVYQGAKLITKHDIVSNGVSVFNYDPSIDTNYDIAKYIARNMYLSLKSNNGQDIGVFNGTINEDYIFRNVLLEALNGTVYAAGYSRGIQETYSNIEDNSYGAFKKLVVGFAKETVNSFGKIDGVLGIKDSYQDPVFGRFLNIADKYFIYICLLFFIIFMIRFITDRSTFSYTVIASVIGVGFLFLFLKILPVFLPSVYNVVLNSVNKDLSYTILATKAEKYDETYRNSSVIGEDGKFLINTTSIDLYKLDDKKFKEVLERYRIDEEDLYTGNIYVLDQTNGVYLEGKTLKLNVDSLMYTNPIGSTYINTPVGLAYQIESDKMYSSVIDYYMPYYLIQEGFIETLNKLSMAYRIPKHSSNYLRGFSKDSFMVYSYINSPPFLTPGDYKQEHEEITGEDLERLYYLFDNPNQLSNSYDFLNLDKMLRNPTPEMIESLWWRTLYDNGLFEVDEDGEYLDKYWNFIASVNLQTKKFLIDLKPQIGMISDENLIKIISLNATMLFNQKGSEVGNWIYPLFLNYQEYSMSDVLLAVFTSDYSRFVTSNLDIVDYVASNSGILTLLVLVIDVVTAFIISTLISFLVPVLSILLGVIMFLRFLTGNKMGVAAKGYLKLSFIIFLCLTMFVSSLGIVSNWSLNLAVWTLLGVHLLILGILYVMLMSLLFNFTELGNSKLNESFSSFMSKTKLSNMIEDLKVSTVNLLQREELKAMYDLSTSKYRYDADMEDISRDSASNLTYLEKRSMGQKGNSKRVVRYVVEEEISEEFDKDKYRF